MNDQGSREGSPYHHHHQQHQQQHGYPPMHQPQPHLQQMSNPQHMFSTPPPPQPQMMLNQPQLAPHPHHHQRPHPLVQTPIPPHYHQMTTPSQTWGGGGGTPQQPSTSGHYTQESDQIFKGATEHLFSAVQQQLESLRDQESEEIQRRDPRDNRPIDSSGTSTPNPISRDGINKASNKDKAMTESGDGLLTVQVRITEANQDLQAQKDQSRAIESQAKDNRLPCSSVDSQQTSVSSVSENLTQNTNPLKDTSNILSSSSSDTSSSSSSSSSSAPPVKPSQECTSEEAKSQHEKDGGPQTDTQTINEKGEVWQTLTIGGKSVRYKVLGNVKMRKATVVSNKAPSAAAQMIKDKDGNSKIVTPNKSGTGAAVLKPGDPHVTNCTLVTSSDMLGPGVSKSPVIAGKTSPSGDGKKKLKIVKILPPGADVNKIGIKLKGKPVNPSVNPSSSSQQEGKQQSQYSPTVVGRPRKYKRPMKYEGSGAPSVSPGSPGSSSLRDVIQPSPSELGRPRKYDDRPMMYDGLAKTSQEMQDEIASKSAKTSNEGEPADDRTNDGQGQASPTDNVSKESNKGDVASDDSEESVDIARATIGKVKRRRLLDDLPGEKRRRKRRRPIISKPVIQDEDDEEDIAKAVEVLKKAESEKAESKKAEFKKAESSQPNKEAVDQSNTGEKEKTKGKRLRKDTRLTRWSHQEITALSGFLVSAKKAGVYNKEWPRLRENDSFWNRAADCCNVVRFDKKKRTGKACAHWAYCYLKPKFVTTSQMSYHFNTTKTQTPDEYYTCKCYKPPRLTECDDQPSKIKSKSKRPLRDRGCQVSALSSVKETQTVVSTVFGISSGLKDFVSMLTPKDALEVADMALHYALKEQTIYNVADNFLELCVAAFKVLQRYRQGNVIEEFARVLATTRDDQLPRMQPDKMPFSMIAYNIRYFNNASPFGLTVPTPYAEWLQGMYNLYGARFLELFEGPIPRKTDISDRHPYRRVLLNVATVSKNYFKRVVDEKDKEEAEAMASQVPLQIQSGIPQNAEGTQEAKRKNLMNRQGKSIRELMTDSAIPVLARRKLQQAFAIMQHYTYLNAPDNEPTCEHCGASIPKPPKPPKKTFRKKGERKRMQGDGKQRRKTGGKRRRLDATQKWGGKGSTVPIDYHRKGNTAHSSHQEPQQRSDTSPFTRNLPYHPSPGASPLERMIINAPGMAPPRELPASLQEDWVAARTQPLSVTPVAVATVRDMYPNHGTVDIMWQPGQPSTGWQHGEVRNQVASQQQQQHGQRTSMVPSTSSTPPAVVQHIGQPQVSHSYY